MENKVDIALASDSNYFDGLLVTAASLAEHASGDDTLSFHILDGGLSEVQRHLLVSRVKLFRQNVEFYFVDVNGFDFSRFPAYHGNRMVYARILLPDLVPNSDFLISCDVDFLWSANVFELWRRRDSDKILSGVIDRFPHGDFDEQMKAFLDKNQELQLRSETYVNGGLLLMNLKMMRDENIPQKVVAFLDKYRDVPYCEQTAFNAVLVNRIAFLPDEFNVFSRNLKSWMMGSGNTHKKFNIHYSGYNVQPWCHRDPHWAVSNDQVLWYKMYAKISGGTYFNAIKRYCTATGYCFRRLLYFALRFPLSRPLVLSLLRNTGRGVWCVEV